MDKNSLAPRGLRNNNPLNIRHSQDKWKGLCPEQTDSEFCQFKTIFDGIRAAFLNVRSHIRQDARRHDRCTVAKEISRWAPASENNTQRYIDFVCERACLGAYDELKVEQKNVMCRLLWAMAEFECGTKISFAYFERAYEMAFNPACPEYV